MVTDKLIEQRCSMGDFQHLLFADLIKDFQ